VAFENSSNLRYLTSDLTSALTLASLKLQHKLSLYIRPHEFSYSAISI
jgi:hypothetical protein